MLLLMGSKKDSNIQTSIVHNQQEETVAEVTEEAEVVEEKVVEAAEVVEAEQVAKAGAARVTACSCARARRRRPTNR